jgi:hypothetical protein
MKLTTNADTYNLQLIKAAPLPGNSLTQKINEERDDERV